METHFAESAKNCEQQSSPQGNQSSFLRLLQKEINRKFQRCQKKSSSLFDQKNGLIPFELWTVTMETYFAEYAKNCEQQSFPQVNQSSFPRLLQMEIKRKFQRCQKKSSSLFDQKNGLFHLNYGLQQWKRTLRNTKKIVNSTSQCCSGQTTCVSPLRSQVRFSGRISECDSNSVLT